MFDLFYSNYPRKEKKKDARKAWDHEVRITKPEVILDALEIAKQSWRGREMQYVPLAASWIRATDFDDEFEAKVDDPADLFAGIPTHHCTVCHPHHDWMCTSDACFENGTAMACPGVTNKYRKEK